MTNYRKYGGHIPRIAFGTSLLTIILLASLVNAQGAMYPEAKLIVLSKESNVSVTFEGSGGPGDVTLYHNLFGLWSPRYQELFWANSTSPNTTFDLGYFPSYTELIFFIKNQDGTFLSGPGNRNPDGVVHAAITEIDSQTWRVGFEDTSGGGDRDYNDVTVLVKGGLYVIPPNPQKPDFLVLPEDITFSNNNPTEGDIVEIQANVHNLGNSTDSNVSLGFYDGDPDNSGQLISTTTINGIGQEENVTKTIQWNTTGKAGTHNIYVKVDPENLINETREDNNKANKEVVIAPTSTPTPLTINITSPINNSYSEESVNFSGTANGGIPPYTYTWTSDKDGALSNITTINTSNEFSKNLTMGTHNISLTVQDSVGNTGIKTITLNVVKQIIDVFVIPTNFASYGQDPTPSDISSDEITKIGEQVSKYYLDASYGTLYMDFKVLDKRTISKDKSYYDPLPRDDLLGFFGWNNVPGKDDGKLKEILNNRFGIKWADRANIEKIDDKTIRVSTGENSLSIRLNEDKTANLAIDDGRIYILKVDDKLNILINVRSSIILSDIPGEIYPTPTRIFAFDLNILNYIRPGAWPDYRSFMINRGDNYKAWAHEIGHNLNRLPDLYGEKNGNIWWWDLMGRGVYVEPPTHPSSFSKLWLKWLIPSPVSYNELPLSIELKPLEKNKFGEKVHFFRADKDVSYIIEARDLPKNSIAEEDKCLFCDGTLENGIVIYKVENFDLSSSSYEKTTGSWKINSISEFFGRSFGVNMDDPTLSTVGDKYVDPFRFIIFTISSAKNDPYYQPTVEIEDTLAGYVRKKIGVVLNNIKINIPKFSNVFYIPSVNTSFPDLDLHAYTPDGKHVGMNYSSGEYEMQIPEAIASGDLANGEEWIFVPNGTQVRYYVDSHDVQKYLEDHPYINSTDAKTEYSTQSVEYGENPQLKQLPDGNYTVTNRTVSEPKINTIEPGITKEITPTLKGDVNGDGSITGIDAMWIAQYVVGKRTGLDTNVADVNGDGSITGIDAMWIAQYVVGKRTW